MARLSTSLALGLILFAASSGTGSNTSGTSAAQGCDPSYPFVCLPPGLGITCDDIGSPVAVIYDPNHGATDPYHLDLDFDGVGCEGF